MPAVMTALRAQSLFLTPALGGNGPHSPGEEAEAQGDKTQEPNLSSKPFPV